MAHIGRSITVVGDITGDEDLVIDGKVEGSVKLDDQHVTVGPNGLVEGEVFAREITVLGRITGEVQASDRIEIQDSGHVEGGLTAPRLRVHEGAVVNGSMSMSAPTPKASPVRSKPAMPKRPQPVTKLAAPTVAMAGSQTEAGD